MRLLLILAICVCTTFQAWAHRISGTVRDSTGAPLPYISVYVKNTTKGVATDLNGHFLMDIQPGKYVLVFQAVGWKPLERSISVAANDITLSVTLRPSVSTLKEVQISADAEDPAYPIIRKAIKAREHYNRPLDAYQVELYIKASLVREYFTYDTLDKKARDTIANLPIKEKMNFIESSGIFSFKAPGRIKFVKEGVKDLSDKHKSSVTISVQYGDEDPYTADFVNRNLFRSEPDEATFNFYRNNIEVPSLTMVPFVSPLSGMAMLSYKYHLDESFVQDTLLIHKIKVIPRRRDAALFSGYIFIVDKLWCIKGVDLEADKSRLINFKYFRVMQDYTPLADTLWLPAEEHFFYNAREGKKRIVGNTIIDYSHYNLKPVFGKNFFKNEISATLDDAYEKDSIWWVGHRRVSLSDDERKYIHEQDSIARYHASAEYRQKQDSIYNHHNFWDYTLNGFGWQNLDKGNELYFDPLISQLYIFGIGGYRQAPGGGFKRSISKANALEGEWKLNYGFKNKDLKGFLKLDYLYLPKRFGHLHIEYRNTYELLNEYESVQAILARGNYVNDIFYSLGHKIEVWNGLSADFTAEYGSKRPITGIDLSGWGDKFMNWFAPDYSAPVDFQAFNELVFDLKLKYVINQKYYSAPYKKINLPAKYPVLKLHYRKGVPGLLNSIADFDFISLKAEDDITVGTMGISKIRVGAGTYLNKKDLRLSDYTWFRRSDYYWFSNPLLSFQLLRPVTAIATPDPYFMANYTHNFNGTVLNKIPIVKRAGLQLIGGAGILLVDENNFRHAELFGGVEWPFRIRRQLMKIGVYYAVADSNQSNLKGEFKFGFDFFNSWTNSWSY